MLFISFYAKFLIWLPVYQEPVEYVSTLKNDGDSVLFPPAPERVNFPCHPSYINFLNIFLILDIDMNDFFSIHNLIMNI